MQHQGDTSPSLGRVFPCGIMHAANAHLGWSECRWGRWSQLPRTSGWHCLQPEEAQLSQRPVDGWCWSFRWVHQGLELPGDTPVYLVTYFFGLIFMYCAAQAACPPVTAHCCSANDSQSMLQWQRKGRHPPALPSYATGRQLRALWTHPDSLCAYTVRHPRTRLNPSGSLPPPALYTS